jgi:hypothetical protein
MGEAPIAAPDVQRADAGKVHDLKQVPGHSLFGIASGGHGDILRI